MCSYYCGYSPKLILNTIEVARYKKEVIEQYCSFKNQRKSLQDVLAQVPLTTAYNCMLA